MAFNRFVPENFYKVRTTTPIPAITPASSSAPAAADPLDVFTFDVATPPISNKGALIVEFTEESRRDEIRFHDVVGNTIYYYRKDRSNPTVAHPDNSFCQMNNVAFYLSRLYANATDFGYVENMGTNKARILGGYVGYNNTLVNISDTSPQTLADGTWYAVFDYQTEELKFIASLT